MREIFFVFLKIYDFTAHSFVLRIKEAEALLVDVNSYWASSKYTNSLCQCRSHRLRVLKYEFLSHIQNALNTGSHKREQNAHFFLMLSIVSSFQLYLVFEIYSSILRISPHRIINSNLIYSTYNLISYSTTSKKMGFLCLRLTMEFIFVVTITRFTARANEGKQYKAPKACNLLHGRG